MLVRHAKAEAHRGDDKSRELAVRGRADAAAVGRWLVKQGIRPDRVVVSSSTRTRQTWQQMGLEAPAPVFDDRVYDASVEDLLEVLTDTPEQVRTLLLVGHNPGIEQLAWHLDDETADSGTRDAMAASFPTSAVAVLALPGWGEAGLLEQFAVVRG